MSDELKEYKDKDGRTYLLDERDAKAGDYTPVSEKNAPTAKNKQATPQHNK
jgi:hypothetical protein